MVDFLIVGRGLAATALMHAFHQNGLSFVVIGSENLSRSSRVAAGIWNPVVFKRLTASWMAQELVSTLREFYGACEKTLHTRLVTPRQIVRPFTGEHEKQHWQKKAGEELAPFLADTIQSQAAGLEGLKIPNGFGLVDSAGNLDVPAYLDHTARFFRQRVRDEVFDHNKMQVDNDQVSYGDLHAHNVVFCEGHLMSRNPFFSWIPMAPAKGELLVARSPEVHLANRIFSRDGFLMDMGNERFMVGATFAWDDLTDQPTESGLAELRAKWNRMTAAPLVVERHLAGVRPSSNDRRPVIGRHPLHRRVFLFNGLGARGVMLAPFFAGKFVLFCLKNEPLAPEADVSRFYKLYERV